MKNPMEDWGTERQKIQVAAVVCSAVLALFVWALIGLWQLP